MLLIVVIPLLITVVMRIDAAKNYSAIELNRIRISTRHRNQLLIRPTTKNVNQTVVAIGLGIIEVSGIDPQKQVITLNVNFEMRWCDHLLRWNTTEQLCLNRRNRSEIFFTTYEVWTPDIMPINGPGKRGRDLKLQYPVLVICNGDVRWSYQEKLVSFCEVDVRNFPFDRQYCSILLQSTIYDASQLKLRSLYNVVRLYNFINTEWEIRHASIEEIDLYNPQHARNFSTIRIQIELVRFSLLYTLKIIFPFSIISSLALVSFCLPTDSGERMAMTVSILLSLTIYLHLISNFVPKTERGLCILTFYTNVIFALVFLSCLCNVLTIFVYYHEQSSRRLKRQGKPILTVIHEGLVEMNRQREEQPPPESHQLLQDVQMIRSLLTNILRRDYAFELPHHFFLHSQPSVKQLATLIDRILCFVYILAMAFCIIFLIVFQYNYQSNLSSTTNQLLDLRKNPIDPVPLYRGCPR